METMKNADVVKYVSTLLNDQYPGNAYVRWPKKLVEKALSEALGVVALFRPDLAVTTVEVELQPGAIQHAPEGCSKVAGVLGILDPDTGVVMDMAEEADHELSKWFPAICSGGGSEYRLGSYSMNGNDSSIFIVNPPVEPGQKATALIQCVGGCADGSVDCQYLSPVVEFMLYRLYSTEDDSTTSAANARMHLTAFSNMLALNLRLVQQYLEGPTNAPAAQQDEA